MMPLPWWICEWQEACVPRFMSEDGEEAREIEFQIDDWIERRKRQERGKRECVKGTWYM